MLVGPAQAFADERAALADLLLRRLDGVLKVRDARLLLLQTDRSTLADVTALLPGGALPTVSVIEGRSDALALQAVCDGEVTWQHLEDLKRAGARAMLVLPVEQMLA